MNDACIIPAYETNGPNKRGYVTYVAGPFNYSQLAAGLADEARATADRINASKKTHIIEVGLELTAIKAKLAHGQFTEWIDRELNFSTTTARNYMRAAKEFADKPATVAVLPPATLYRLANAAPDVRADVVARAEAGEYMDRDEVDEAIRKPKLETAEAKKVASGQAAKEAKAKRRRERSEQNWRAKWEAEEAEAGQRQSVCAEELVAKLAAHFDLDAIAELNVLWRKANFAAIDKAVAVRRREGGAE